MTTKTYHCIMIYEYYHYHSLGLSNYKEFYLNVNITNSAPVYSVIENV